MSAKYWKLVITPISTASAAAAAREAVVEGDNWLSALRAARRALGEDGAVPAGASCVMSATGEVTILDSATRLRYVLARHDTPPAGAATGPAPGGLPPQQATKPPSVRPPAPAQSLPPPAASVSAPSTPRRAPTMAYSPEESAAIRAQAEGQAPRSESSAGTPAEAAPSFAPARPLSRPPSAESDAQRSDPRRPIPAKRSATVGYAASQSGQAASDGAPAPAAPLPEPLGQEAGSRPSAPVAASAPPSPAPLPAAPMAAPLPAAPMAAPLPAAPMAAAPAAPTLAEAQPPVAAADAGAAVRPIGRPGRKQTIAYSPQESAAARAQMGLTPPASVSTTTSHVSSAQDHLVQTEVPSMMISLGHRDEEPSAESPLTYRERSYFWQPPAKRDEVERALRAELATLRQSLSGRPRGQYVNLAVFDHAFTEKPTQAPVATLQWKDWRGDPVFAWLAEQAGAQWAAPQQGQPVASSYIPPAANAAAPPSAAPPASVAPPASAAPPPASAPAPAPQSGINSERATQPARRLTPVPDNQQVKRDNTGEQDLRLAVAFEATQDLYFLNTPADGLDFAVRLLSELIPAEAVSGCIYDINTDEFRFVAVTGTGATERRAAAVRGNMGLFSAAVRSGLDNLVIPDLANEPRYDPETDGRSGLLASNMAFFVLHRAGQLFGMLQIINREGPKGFREGDVAVGGYIANQVTSFLREKRGLR